MHCKTWNWRGSQTPIGTSSWKCLMTEVTPAGVREPLGGRASSILHPGIKTLTIQTCLFTCILLIKKNSAIFKLKTSSALSCTEWFGQKSFTIETSFCKVIALRMVSNVISMLLHFCLLSNLNTCIYQVLCFLQSYFVIRFHKCGLKWRSCNESVVQKKQLGNFHSHCGVYINYVHFIYFM